MTTGFVIAAPSSGSGKTLVTLGLLRAFSERGVQVAGAKVGPDYIDPRFHEAASGRPSVSLDPWAMRPELLKSLLPRDADLLLVEGVMGLFDGAAGGAGSTADLAALLDLPVVLVVDVRRQAQTAAAVALGCARLRSDIRVAGAILNGVAGMRHAALASELFEKAEVPLLGYVARSGELAMPSRHLGLVQAMELGGLEDLLEGAADAAATVDLDALQAIARPLPGAQAAAPLPPPGQRIAVAEDEAFAFAYPHLLDGWRRSGAELLRFSPLSDAAPAADADAVFLPGGYPELHASRLAVNTNFLDGVRAAADRGALLYGECGGYMVLGETLVDAEGIGHAMAGLLPLETSFAERKMTLGYRSLRPLMGAPWKGSLRAHEFHYATIARAGRAQPLFHVERTANATPGPTGMRVGKVMGSFMHVIDHV
jgi:cobyrinic acid a,c-diamide synthase